MITKITIKLDDGTEFVLEMDKAKELYYQLDSIFGKKETYIPYPYVVKTNPLPYQPVWVGDDANLYSQQLTCNTN